MEANTSELTARLRAAADGSTQGALLNEAAAALESRVTKERELLGDMSAWMDYHIVMFPEVFGEAREREGRALLERYAALYAAPAAAELAPRWYRESTPDERQALEVDLGVGRAPSPAPSPQGEMDWPNASGLWERDGKQYVVYRDWRSEHKGEVIAQWMESPGVEVSASSPCHGNWRRVTPPASQELEELNVICSENAAEAHRLTAQLAEANAWKQAIIDAAVVNWTYREEHERNPRQAIADLIDCVDKQAHDPMFSQRAYELEQRFATLSAELADARAKNGGVAEIAAERARQMREHPDNEEGSDGEGWSTCHDQYDHSNGELALVAACYALSAVPPDQVGQNDYVTWPWEKRWDKRGKHDRRRKLVIAGALIAAELDRLALEKPTQPAPTEAVKAVHPALVDQPYKIAFEKLVAIALQRSSDISAHELMEVISEVHPDPAFGDEGEAEAVKAEPPKLWAQISDTAFLQVTRNTVGNRNAWFRRHESAVTFYGSADFLGIDRDASDHRAVELYDADLAASNEGSET
jgi:hypothetical protein